MDPLGLLREFVTNDQLDQVRVKGDRVEFGDKYTFLKSTKTTYKSQQGKGDFYSLDTVLFFLQNRHVPFTQYIKTARDLSLGSVLFVDRKDLESYLTGQTDSSVFIQLGSEVLPLGPAQGDDIDNDRAAKRRREDAGASGRGAMSSEARQLESLLSNEQQLRDRNSMLVVSTKPPGGRVLAIMNSLLADLEHRQRIKMEEKRAAAKKVREPPSGSIPVKPSARFDRKPEKDKEYKNIGINPYGYASSDAKRDAKSSASDQHRRQHGSSSSGRANGSSSTSPHKAVNKNEIPIILVPAGMSSKINMYNIKALLEKGVYETPDTSSKKSSMLVISRTFSRNSGKALTYWVTDKPPTKSHDWKRVVAVFCQGVNWQFKDFPFKGAANGDLVDTFSNMLAVFLAFHDEQVPENVKKWNCKILKLHRESRHKDIQVVQDFYMYLDQFISAHKAYLANQ